MQGFADWLYNEMPIVGWQTQGDFGRNAKRQYGFNRQDAMLLTSPKAVDKIHRKWSNSKENFDFIFLRAAGTNQHRESGEQTPEFVRNELGIKDYVPNSDAINIIFIGNYGDQRIPMTAWTIAHRMGHAIRRDENFESYFANEIMSDFSRLLKELYKISPYKKTPDYYYGSRQPNDQALKALAHQVGTMASARNGELRNFYEFVYELLAQYIITGKIRFKPLPKSLILQKRMAWGNPAHTYAHADPSHNLDDWNDELGYMAEKYEHYLDSIFQGLIGRIFVM